MSSPLFSSAPIALPPAAGLPSPLGGAKPRLAFRHTIAALPTATPTPPWLKAYNWVSQNRGREMIGEDIVANGFLDTAVDMLRGLIYGTGRLNFALGRERALSEVFSVVTDSLSPGLLAQGVGSVADKHLGTFTTSYINQGVISHVQAHVGQQPQSGSFAPVLASVVKRWAASASQPNPQAEQLAQLLTPERLGQLLNQEALNQGALNKGGKRQPPTLNHTNVMALAHEVTPLLGLNEGIEVYLHHPPATGKAMVLPPVSLPLPTLLEDMALLQHHIAHQLHQAPALLARTQRWKNVQMAQLLGSMGLTLTVPLGIKWATRKLTGGDAYPGEAGLSRPPTGKSYRQGYFGAGSNATALATPQPITPPSFAQRAFPYVSDALAKGNPLPLLGAALPLVFAAGLFRTSQRSFVLPSLGAEVKTLAKGLLRFEPAKQWRRNWLASLDFERGFPFTTQQQMALLFAGLISSRILTARSGNEYRERTTDGGLGWGLWIMGSPTIRPLLAKHVFEGAKYELLKILPAAKGASRVALRSAAELELLAGKALAAKGITLEAAKQQLSKVSAAAFALNIGLLGIVEPFTSMGITWLSDTRNEKQST